LAFEKKLHAAEIQRGCGEVAMGKMPLKIIRWMAAWRTPVLAGQKIDRFLPVGDPITEGGASFSNWRCPLWERLCQVMRWTFALPMPAMAERRRKGFERSLATLTISSGTWQTPGVAIQKEWM
jgi:hypothetical protein